jgi:hypothetical protein
VIPVSTPGAWIDVRTSPPACHTRVARRSAAIAGLALLASAWVSIGGAASADAPIASGPYNGYLPQGPTMAIGPERSGNTGTFTWPDDPPAGIPFARSRTLSGVRFDGPWADYALGDTWYPSWGEDGNLYSGFMDGDCNGTGGSMGGWSTPLPSSMGTAVISGDDPMDLALRCGVVYADHGNADGRYAEGSLSYDGVWYYGSTLFYDQTQPGAEQCGENGFNGWGPIYCTIGPLVGYDVSGDGGRSWQPSPETPSDPLFGESIANGNRVKLGALHWVDLGRNQEYAGDSAATAAGYAYAVTEGGGGPTSQDSWLNADNLYMVRVKPSPATINDAADWEFYAGTDASGQPAWSHDLGDIEPLLHWSGGHLGAPSISYDAPLHRYLLWTSAPSDGVNDVSSPFDSMLLESSRLTGPYELVQYFAGFGPQAYQLSTSTKFMSPDGLTMWLTGDVVYDDSLHPDPAGGFYGLTFREITLVPAR